MQASIQPKIYDLVVEIGNTQINTKSAKNIGNLLMEIDFRNHPAWSNAITNTVQLSNRSQQFQDKFTKKFKK
ncbi:MAG: 50S ribosomal protein L31 [Rickettsiales bacterium]